MRSIDSIKKDIYNSSRSSTHDDVLIRSAQSNQNRSYENINDQRNSEQKHTHEYLGSVKIAEKQEDPHNHRFAGVTGEAIPLRGGNHYHRLKGKTDFYEEHFHMVDDKTGPAIPIGNDRHVHFVQGNTTVSDGHSHEFQFATLINDPIGD